MIIKTVYGEVESDDLSQFDIPKAALDFIEKRVEAVSLFFAEELDLTDIDEKETELIQEIMEIAVAEGFDDPPKAFALCEFTEEPLADITDRDGTYSVGGHDYYVLTDEEATAEAIDRAKSNIDDMGLELFGEDNQEYVVTNFVKTDWFDDALEESNRSYAEDIQGESAEDDRYVNRLHEEMVQMEVMEEPEYPAEPDEGDFDSEEEYDEAYSEWEDKVSDFKTDLESEVEGNIDAYVKKRNEEYPNSVKYWIDNMGMEDTVKTIKEQKLLDVNKAAAWVVDTDGRGSISSYDGEEHEHTVTYKGKKYTFYIFNMG